MGINQYIQQLGKKARTASQHMAIAPRAQKDQALMHIAQLLLDKMDALIAANQNDMQQAKQAGLDSALLDRLQLDEKGINAMAEGCRQIAVLPDPVGEVSDLNYRPSGIQVGKMRVPLGVIGIIYESRPNVTIDAAALCLKSGNAVILRGGSEAFNSNQAIAECISEGLQKSGLPRDSVQVMATTDRSAVKHLISMPEFVDVIIPRGGKGLIETISNDSKVPVIKHLDGICHVYIDEQADAAKAHSIALNAKTHRYGVCNAMETLLVHQEIAETVLPDLARDYIAKGVQLRACEGTKAVLQANGIDAEVAVATEKDWAMEYLAPILSIKTVTSFEQAVAHIALYGSAHTDCIVTENYSTARRFIQCVDSSSVVVNASSRFADGFEYGLGAEIGISTDKLHARGPVGLEGLTSQKYVVYGDGHIRQ